MICNYKRNVFLIKRLLHCRVEFNLRVNDKVNYFPKLRGRLIQQVLIAVLINNLLFMILYFHLLLTRLSCISFSTREWGNWKIAILQMGWIWCIEVSLKKILLLNQRAREAQTCVAPIFRKKVTRSFAPQSSPINNENRHLIDVLKNTGQIELQFMHFQSDKKKQKRDARAQCFFIFTRDNAR